MNPEMSIEKVKEMGKIFGRRYLELLPAEEKLKGVPVEEKLKGVPVEEKLKGVSLEELEAYIQKRRDNEQSNS